MRRTDTAVRVISASPDRGVRRADLSERLDMPAQDDRRRHSTRERAPWAGARQLEIPLDCDATSAVRTSGLLRGPQNDDGSTGAEFACKSA
jgi:hypothetical protein